MASRIVVGILSTCTLVTWLGSCSAVTSISVDACPADRNACRGNNYYLPKKRVQLTATRQVLDLPVLLDQRKELRARAQELGSAISGLDAKIDETSRLLDQLEEDAATRQELGKYRATQLRTELQRAEVEDKIRSLEMQIAAVGAGKVCGLQVELALLPAEPDLKHGYRAQMKHWPVRSEDLTITTNRAGLLNTNPAGESRTRQRVIALSQSGDEDATNCGAIDHRALFDPVADAIPVLPAAFAAFRIGVDEVDSGGEAASRGAVAGDDPVPGLVYRRSLPYIFTLAHCRNEPCEVQQASVVMLPNDGPVSVLPFNASPFVETVHEVEFREGELVRWGAERPAELTEIIRIPIDLINSLLSAPADFVRSLRATP